MSYELMFQKAVQLHQNGALNEAEQIYRQILETTPNNADILNLLGLIAQSKGIHNEAVSYFYKAINSAPKHFPIYFNLAISLEAQSKHLEALEAYNKVLSLKPDIKEAYFGISTIYWQLNKKEEARQALTSALEVDGEYSEARINLAELNDDISTLEIYAKNNNFNALYYLGRRSFSQKDYSSAIEYLQKANELSSSDEIKTLYGEALIANNQTEKALPIFYQALQINPHNDTASMHIADIETDLQHYKEAEKFYKRAIELNPHNLQTHTNYANMLCKCKRTLEALEEYRQAVIISPHTPEISYNLSIILRTLEDYEQSLALMFNAYYQSLQHNDWSIHIAETLILFHRQSPEKALKIAENWHNKMPNNIASCYIWDVLNNRQPKNEKEYNALLFDTLATEYEQTLKNINYQVVSKIAEIISPLTGEIIDLGCGTGLVAETLKNKENNFIGVDISSNMLSYAQQKNLYTRLEHKDIISYLQKQKLKHYTIISADVFCYFGDLSKIFELCSPQKLIFSIESDENINDFQIQPTGRYKHNPQHIEKQLYMFGYHKIQRHKLILRQENGENISGEIFIAEN